MRIEGPRRIEPSSGRGVTRAGGGEGFALDGAAKTAAPATAAPVAGVGSVDALLALQEGGEPLTGRKRAVRRAQDMLDLLDGVRQGLLSGAVPRQVLRRLQALVNERREEFNEPRLQTLIDEIDLRAQVELAKLGQAA